MPTYIREEHLRFFESQYAYLYHPFHSNLYYQYMGPIIDDKGFHVSTNVRLYGVRNSDRITANHIITGTFRISYFAFRVGEEYTAFGQSLTMNMLSNGFHGDGYAIFHMLKKGVRGIKPTDVSMAFEELFLGSRLWALMVIVRIEEDPRLKAISISNSLTGLQITYIKHAPTTMRSGPYTYVYRPGERRPAFDDACDVVVKDVFPKNEFGTSGGDIGMLRGGWEADNLGSYYNSDTQSVPVSLFKTGTAREYNQFGFGLPSFNPLCDQDIYIIDFNPMPSTVYSVRGYYNDARLLPPEYQVRLRNNPKDRPENYPILIAYQQFEVAYMKGGKIISQEYVGNHYYHYGILTENEEQITAIGQYSVYRIGQWVIINKAENGNWYISPTSYLYYQNQLGDGKPQIG